MTVHARRFPPKAIKKKVRKEEARAAANVKTAHMIQMYVNFLLFRYEQEKVAGLTFAPQLTVIKKFKSAYKKTTGTSFRNRDPRLMSGQPMKPKGGSLGKMLRQNREREAEEKSRREVGAAASSKTDGNEKKGGSKKLPQLLTTTREDRIRLRNGVSCTLGGCMGLAPLKSTPAKIVLQVSKLTVTK